jgi:DNA-binding NtrC family response regulator
VPPTITPRAWAALAEYAFPGNVRELGHAIEHAVVLARTGRIDLSELPGDIAGVAAPSEDPGGFRPLQVAAREFEREYLLRALAFAEGKRTKAAELLGISRKNLWEKLRLHGVEDKERPPAETLPVGNPSDATDTGR